MKSATKYELTNDTIYEIFKKAGFNKISDIEPLKAGEFNSAYTVNADGNDYVLKIAPKDNANILTYEKNLMSQEVFFYSQIKKQTNVCIPKIILFDDSKKIIESNYFIMEKLYSKPLNEIKLNKEEKAVVLESIGKMIGELHNINGDKFGYIQNGLFDNWYDAIKNMTKNLVDDCKALGKNTKDGEMLLKLIDRYKDILIKVESTYTHFDIWEGNVFYEKSDAVKLTLIDTERSFWGDKLGDFVEIDIMRNLNKKAEILKGYNQTAKDKLKLNDDENIRFNILVAYLALIVYSEKFVRYSKTQTKYIINVFLAKTLFKRAFKELGAM